MSKSAGLDAFPLFLKTSKTFLQGIIPNSSYEVVYDNGPYYAVVVIYPNRKRIMQFNDMYDKMKKKFADALIPAISLVSKGVYGSYFVVYFDKKINAA